MKIDKIDLVTNIMSPDLPVVVGEEVEQHLFFSRTGNVFFMSLEFADEAGSLKQGRLERLVLDLEIAAEAVDKLAGFFMQEPKAYYGSEREGNWKAVLTDETGEEHIFEGPLTSGYVYDNLDISKMIRALVGFEGVFALDGESEEDEISKVLIEFFWHDELKAEEGNEDSVDRVLEYYESLLITRESETIEIGQKLNGGFLISHSYHIPQGVSDLLNNFDSKTLFRKTFADQTQPEAGESGGRRYEISLEYAKGEPFKVSGIFDKAGLPTDWYGFVARVASFISFYGLGQILLPKVPGVRKRKPGEYMLCSVVFGDEEKTYYYFSEDEEIDFYDDVWVPAGKDNAPAIATVVDIEFFKKEDIPFPFEKIKTIIGPVDE
ncbi:MAG TPA: hypothetical protein PKW24_05925 [Clostridiales bacterium]|jgi:hypothetical protein|nr:hypothetical protein [Clostridiales bacterium]